MKGLKTEEKGSEYLVLKKGSNEKERIEMFYLSKK